MQYIFRIENIFDLMVISTLDNLAWYSMDLVARVVGILFSLLLWVNKHLATIMEVGQR